MSPSAGLSQRRAAQSHRRTIEKGNQNGFGGERTYQSLPKQLLNIHNFCSQLKLLHGKQVKEITPQRTHRPAKLAIHLGSKKVAVFPNDPRTQRLHVDHTENLGFTPSNTGPGSTTRNSPIECGATPSAVASGPSGCREGSGCLHKMNS